MNRRKEQAPGVVELRLSGSPEDTGTLISVLERLAAGLPVTTVGVEILHRTGPLNRRDPGECVYVRVRVGQAPGGWKPALLLARVRSSASSRVRAPSCQ